MLNHFRERNFWIVFSADTFLLCCAYIFAYFLRFDGNIPESEMETFAVSIGWIVAVKLGIYFFMGLYRGMWRYTSISDVIKILEANILAFLVISLVLGFWTRFQGFSRGIVIIDAVLATGFVAGLRLILRVLILGGRWKNGFLPVTSGNFQSIQRALIVGAGDTGEKLLREIRQNRNLPIDVIGFIDDNPFKQHHSIHGIPVLGNRSDIPGLVKKHTIDQVIIAIPSATAHQMRQVVDFCKISGKPFKTVPGLPDLITGRLAVSAIRDVNYDDLLGREAVCRENDGICSYVSGKRVMVTGAAGSIGSELCRQIAALQPSQLILLDRNESSLYELHLDLQAKFPNLQTAEVLAATQNRSRMDHVFRTSRPEVVFHAAAYKHVPMMEMHPWEAVFNNIVGSLVLLDMCQVHKVARCVMISTDKAVRPTNVMGASKRMVERLVQSYAQINGVRYMAVRFGNVLGSVGSVLPLFKKQIAQGGPVTVTHPEVTRYFMTIPEAVSLVLQAGGLGNGGEIFVLKMGTPVRIADMARDLISLSGFIPDKEIKIVFSGLRPGEKLYEELISEGENVAVTRLKDIMVMKNADILSLKDMNRHIRDLVELAKAGDAVGIKEKLHIVVPEYSPQFETQPQNPMRVAEPRKPAEASGQKIHESMMICGQIATQNS